VYNRPVIVAFDTCTKTISVSSADRVWTREGPLKGNRSLYEGLLDVLGQESIKEKAIRAMIFTVGPGSFTGVRIGIATALGFYYTAGVSLYPVHTLLALAHAAQVEGDVHVSMPAYGGEYYYAAYQISHEKDHVITPPCLVKELPGSVTFPSPVMTVAEALIRMGLRGNPSLPPIQPVYVGVSDAERGR